MATYTQRGTTILSTPAKRKRREQAVTGSHRVEKEKRSATTGVADLLSVELLSGFEPETSSLPTRQCS